MGVFDAVLLGTTLTLVAPLLLAALGELVSEKAGVINIGLEGYMAMGAFWGFWGSYHWDNPIMGVLVGAAAGALLASLMALLTLVAGANQIVVGVGLNLVGIGVATMGYRQIFGSNPGATVTRSSAVAIPLLSDIPGLGEALFDQTLVVYLAVLLVPALWLLLHRTSWGLRIRACGDLPAAADTSGISVRKVRLAAVLTAGALAGVAGASLSALQLGLYEENLVSGRGFLALAAVIFGRWVPGGVFLACTLFAGADALQLRLQAEGSVPAEVWVVVALTLGVAALWSLRRQVLDVARRTPVGAVAGVVALLAAAWIGVARPDVELPYQLWRCLPYVLTLIALAGAMDRTRSPGALAEPYSREDAH